MTARAALQRNLELLEKNIGALDAKLAHEQGKLQTYSADLQAAEAKCVPALPHCFSHALFGELRYQGQCNMHMLIYIACSQPAPILCGLWAPFLMCAACKTARMPSMISYALPQSPHVPWLCARRVKAEAKQHAAVQRELDAANERFKEFERRDVKLREDLKHLKARRQKLAERAQKEGAKQTVRESTSMLSPNCVRVCAVRGCHASSLASFWRQHLYTQCCCGLAGDGGAGSSAGGGRATAGRQSRGAYARTATG